jgi:hypothetical protein
MYVSYAAQIEIAGKGNALTIRAMISSVRGSNLNFF